MPLLEKRQRRDAKNPLVFFDIAIDGEEAGRIVFELYKNVVPKVMHTDLANFETLKALH